MRRAGDEPFSHPLPNGPGTVSVFSRQFGKEKVRASVRGELRSAFSSSSAAQPPRLSVARGRGKRVPVYFWVGSPGWGVGWGGQLQGTGPSNHLAASPGYHRPLHPAQPPLPRVWEGRGDAGAAGWGR